MAASFEDLMILLGLLAEASNEKVSPLRLEFTAKHLFLLGADNVCEALGKLLQSARRFPTVAEVKAEMGRAELTPEDEAKMIAERILTAVGQFGEIPPGNTTTPEAVRMALGIAAWEVVGRSGGWNAVVDRSGENQVSARAQIRDIAGVYLKTGVIERGTLPEKTVGASEVIGEAKRRHRILLPEAPQMTDEQKRLLEAKIADLKQQRADMVARADNALEITRRQLAGNIGG